MHPKQIAPLLIPAVKSSRAFQHSGGHGSVRPLPRGRVHTSNLLDRDQGVLRHPFAFGGSSIPGFGTSDPARFNNVVLHPRSNTAVSGRGNSYFDGTGGGSATGSPSPFFRRVGSGLTFAAGAGRYGNLGRNVFHGPGIDNWDTSAFKRFVISEHQNVEFRGEFFNIFNHTQFANPNGSIGSANFGKVTAIQGNPRIVQFTLKYQF